MNTNIDVVTMGECMALVYPDNPVQITKADSLKLDIAGAESNLAIALARMNHKVRFISRLGADPFGQLIKSVLLDEGVDTDAIEEDPYHPTGLFFREWLPDGQRRVYYYRSNSAASNMTPSNIDDAWFHGARILHLTGITPALSYSCMQACYKAIEIAKDRQMIITFDPNYRKPLWDYTGAQEILLPIIRLADILLLGHEDAQAIFNEQNDQKILEFGRSLGPKIIILKRAERGAIMMDHDTIIEVDAYPVKKILDPVGAGDGFDAGFLAGWLRGLDPRQSIQLAAKIGALAVTTMGDYHGYPYNSQLT